MVVFLHPFPAFYWRKHRTS